MAKKLSTARNQTYRIARDIGNVQAALQGPGPYVKRVARRSVYRKTNGATQRLLKGLKLW